jgi:hypothetical protein
MEKSRLTMPRVAPTENTPSLMFLGGHLNDDEENDCRHDLLIQGLVERLPKTNFLWSLEDRAKWLRTAASIFSLVYKADDHERREISVLLIEGDNLSAEEPSPANTVLSSMPEQT